MVEKSVTSICRSFVDSTCCFKEIYFQICIMVFICVVFSVTNVCGYAHFLGLTIEIVTSITLILSVGLALDYAAHVGVIFSCQKYGTRQEKTKRTLGYA